MISGRLASDPSPPIAACSTTPSLAVNAMSWVTWAALAGAAPRASTAAAISNSFLDMTGSIGLDADGVEEGGEHLVVADEEEELDRAPLVEMGSQRAPRRVLEVAGGVQLVDRGEQGLLARRPSAGAGALDDAGHVVGGQPHAAPHRDVVLELVRAPAQVRHAQDHQLGVAARQLAARHEPAGEPQPAAEQAPVAAERQEDVRRGAAGHAAGDPREDPREDADVAPRARRDARDRAH